jgi:hypothetical protein
MTDNDQEILIYRIISGKTIFNFHNEEYELHAPSLDIKYKAALLYDNILNEEKFDDWFREEYATNIMISMEIWNIQTDNMLKQLEKKLDNLKVLLYNAFFLPSKTKKIRADIKNTKHQINKIYLAKQNFITNTLEGYAQSIKNEYIICETLYKNNELVFDYSCKEKDKASFTHFNSILQEIDKLVISTDVFKILARNPLWKSYWNTAKYNKLFDRPSICLTDEQRALLNISKMYDNIYEHPECPDEMIIADNDALDGWMIVQKQKNESNKKESQMNNSLGKAKNSGEVFIMADSNDDIESIYSMNTAESANDLKAKMDYISKTGGTIAETELPDVKRKISMTIAQLNKGK